MLQKFKYECCTCKKVFVPDETKYLCPLCADQNKPGHPPKGILRTLYDYNKPVFEGPCEISQSMFRFEELKMNHFIDILPIENIKSYPNLRIGKTPQYLIRQINREKLNHRLFIKDDSQNPTYSFKDRASALVSAFAKENGIATIITASTGNAGSSLAGICASQGQKAIILVPETAPVAKLSQIIMYGAQLVPIKGTYDDAFDLSIKASLTFGWYNRNTAYNPFTIEGKKTVSFEIFEQMDYTIPDHIFLPVGDGVIISAVYKGFEDLLNFEIINKIPKVVAIQSEGSNNLIRNLNSEKFVIKKSNTIADSISVDIPRNFYMAKEYILKYNGEFLSVSDKEILNASAILSQNTGLFAEPAAAASFAGYLNYAKNYKLEENTDNLVLLTGSGLKDLKSISKFIEMPASIYPEIENLMKLLNK